MSAEITIRDDGTAEAAYALTPAWHGLGEVVPAAMKSGQAQRLAQLDWTVGLAPVFLRFEDDDGTVRYEELPRRFATVREDRPGVAGYLGLVTDQYVIVQNREAFAFLDSIFDDHTMLYESAFSLRGGRIVVLVARMPKADTIVDGDVVHRYIMFSTHHDGTGAVNFGPTHVRPVCANTWKIALQEGNVGELRLAHNKNIHDQLDRARALLAVANESFDAHAAACRKMAQRVLKPEEWAWFLDELCPLPAPIDAEWSQRREDRIAETRRALVVAFNDERTQIGDGRWTAWAAFNAATQVVDHTPRKGTTGRGRAEARWNVTQHGTGHNHKSHAWKVACQLADVKTS